MLCRLEKTALMCRWRKWHEVLEVNRAIARAGKIMNRVMCRFMSAQLVAGWERWMDVQEASLHAGVVMRRCLHRLGHVFVAAALSKWADTVQQAHRAAADAAHAQALADLEAASKLSLLDSEALRAQIEQQKREKAGRIVQYCLNRITSAARVKAWERWLEVNQAMARAGKIMNRVMCRFAEAQLVVGWERWMDVQEAQQHAAAVMERSLHRLGHIYVAAALSKWADTVHQLMNGVAALERPSFEFGSDHYLHSLVYRCLVHVSQKMVHRSFAAWRMYCTSLSKQILLGELGRLRQDHKRRRRLQREAYRAGVSTNEQVHSQQLEAVRATQKVGKGATEAARIELQRCQQQHTAALKAQKYEHTMAISELLNRISSLTSLHDVAMREKDADWGVILQETAKQSEGMNGRMQSSEGPSSPQLAVASSLPPAMAMGKLLGLLGRFSPRNKIRIIDLFNALDQDRSGSVSRAELEAGLRRFGAQGLGEHEVEEIVHALDTDGDGEIDLRELRIGLRVAARGQPRGFGR
jgi:hypothetical protein